jgi:hypothetical protein
MAGLATIGLVGSGSFATEKSIVSRTLLLTLYSLKFGCFWSAGRSHAEAAGLLFTGCCNGCVFATGAGVALIIN